MIINQTNENVPVIYGESTVKRATINPDELAKLQYLLTKGLYSDPIGATIVEWTNNAVDSVVMSGKDPIKNPVVVEIGSTANFKNYFFRVTDKGLGLDKNEFENVCMSYLSSTKTHTNAAIGAFGIGMKSFLSLEKQAIFTCRKNGYEWKFMAYQGAEFMDYDLLSEGPTEEENGVICEIALKDWNEKYKFQEKCKYKLAYYDTVVLIIDKNVVNNTIYREKHFQWSTLIDNSKPMHLSLKDVYYEIDFTKLEIPTIYLPVCLRFELSDGLQPTPSRESLIYNEGTKAAILKRLREFADWVVTKYNENIEVNSSILKVWSSIDDYKPTYHLNEKSIELEKLKNFTAIIPKNLDVDGIKLQSLKYYKKEAEDLLMDYEGVFETTYSKAKRKYFNTIPHCITNNIEVVLIESRMALRGISGAFLMRKYKGKTLYIVKSPRTKKLKSVHSGLYDKSYFSMLRLDKFPKSLWRGLIQEWQLVVKQVEQYFQDETDLQNDPLFMTFEEEEKERRKLSQIKSNNYKALNKQEGEVTIHVANDSSRTDSGMAYAKKAVRIDAFHKEPTLFVVIEESDEEFIGKFNLGKKRVTFIKVGPREIKKLPKAHNIITMQEFEKSKPFRRLATALRAEKAVDSYEEFNSSTEAIIEDYSARMKELHERLNKYVKNADFVTDGDTRKVILDMAEANNLWDEEYLSDVKKFEELAEQFNFVEHISTHDEVEAKKIISQLLIFRKKHKGAFDDYELVKKQPVVVVEAEIDKEEALVEAFLNEDISEKFPF